MGMPPITRLTDQVVIERSGFGGLGKVYIGLMMVLALSALDQGVIATALPHIIRDFGRVTDISTVVVSYSLCSTASMPIYGKLSDRNGRRPILYLAITVFLIGSLLSATSQNLPMLIISRAIQGIGGGGLLPLSQSIVADLVPSRERGRFQGWFTSVYAICAIAGPAVGGFIISIASWRWLFYINVPIAISASIAIALGLPPQAKTSQQPKFDYVGACALSVATISFLLAISLAPTFDMIGSASITSIIGVPVAASLFFFIWSTRSADPLLPLGALKHNKTLYVGCLVMALTFIGLMGTNLLLPLLFQGALGLSPWNSGLAISPLMVAMLAMTIINGKTVTRYGRYKALQLAGLSAMVIGLATVSVCLELQTEPSLILVSLSLAALGGGLGLLQPNMTVAVQNAVPIRQIGTSTAALAFFRSLGGAIGVSIAGYVFNRLLPRQPSGALSVTTELANSLGINSGSALSASIAGTFGVCLAFLVIGWVVLWLLPELALKQSTQPQPNTDVVNCEETRQLPTITPR